MVGPSGSQTIKGFHLKNSLHVCNYTERLMSYAGQKVVDMTVRVFLSNESQATGSGCVTLTAICLPPGNPQSGF